jgi:hypothetical protein
MEESNLRDVVRGAVKSIEVLAPDAIHVHVEAVREALAQRGLGTGCHVGGQI